MPNTANSGEFAEGKVDCNDELARRGRTDFPIIKSIRLRSGTLIVKVLQAVGRGEEIPDYLFRPGGRFAFPIASERGLKPDIDRAFSTFGLPQTPPSLTSNF
jgi:hypothetical protein